MSGETLDLLALLDLLGYTPEEYVQICGARDGNFSAAIHARASATGDLIRTDADQWFGVNPVQATASGGRPAAKEVTRLAAVWADLDHKPDGARDLTTSRAIIDALSGALGTPPVALTLSGHGAQPLWAVEDGAIGSGEPGALTFEGARVLLRRWGRLVHAVAARHDAKVDSVFDLPRILRAPGSVNHKDTQRPVPVLTVAGGGAPITVEQLTEALDAWGVPELPEDREDAGSIVAPPADWKWAEKTCGYAAKMIKGWTTDTPTGRHPWLAAQSVRLAALHRNGCTTEADFDAGATTLHARFRALLATGEVRKEHPGEVRDLWIWGQHRAACMSEAALASEIGGHTHDVITIGKARLRAVPDLPPTSSAPSTSTTTTTTSSAAPNTAVPHTVRLSDDGNAAALIEQHGKTIRFCPDRARWYSWRGHRWQIEPVGGGTIRELAKDVALTMPDGRGVEQWRQRSLSALGTTNCLTQASTDRRVVISLSDIDADPWALNTPGGIIDLRTGMLTPSNPDALHSRSTTCTPDARADPSVWLDFLAITFGGDQELIDYLQRLIGYSATGFIGPHVLPFAHGSGGNGKGAFLEAVTKVLGDYATTAPNAFLMARTYSQHETEIARLAGARMVLCSEVNENDKFDEAKVKQLTGGDTLTARFMRQDHFTFQPTHHLWLLGNHRPSVTSGGRGFWRRCRLIPFLHEVPEQERIDDMQGTLARDHGPAILAWIAAGAAAFHHDGLQEPASVTEATAAYARDQDTIGRFVEDSCYRAQGLRVDTRELCVAYERWCSDSGEQAVTAKRLGMELRTRFGVDTKKSNGRRFYEGLALIPRSRDEELAPELVRRSVPADEGLWER